MNIRKMEEIPDMENLEHLNVKMLRQRYCKVPKKSHEQHMFSGIPFTAYMFEGRKHPSETEVLTIKMRLVPLGILKHQIVENQQVTSTDYTERWLSTVRNKKQPYTNIEEDGYRIDTYHLGFFIQEYRCLNNNNLEMEEFQNRIGYLQVSRKPMNYLYGKVIQGTRVYVEKHT